jgi:hypothetical protein
MRILKLFYIVLFIECLIYFFVLRLISSFALKFYIYRITISIR